MTHSLEARAPLVDHHVIELGAALAGAAEASRAQGQAHPQARLRRPRARRDHQPTQEGVRPPHRVVAARAACTGSRASCCCRPRRAGAGCSSPTPWPTLLDRHRAGEDHGERIWNLVVLETWHREMVDGRAAFARETRQRAEAIARDEATEKRARAQA